MSNIAAVGRVAGTYAARGLRAPIAWVMLVGWVGMAWALTHDPSAARRPEAAVAVAAALAAVAAGMGSILVAVHAKGQFATGRARVVPGYRAAHVGVAAAMAAVFAVVVPAAVAEWQGVWAVGTVAWGAVAAAAVWWWVIWPSRVSQLVWMAAWLAIMSPRGLKLVAWVSQGVNPGVAWGIAAVGVGAVVAAAARVATLHEEMRAYHQVLLTGRRLGGEGMGAGGEAAVGGVQWGWVMDSVERRLARLERRDPDAIWRRVGRWRLGFTQGQVGWFCGVMAGGLFLVFVTVAAWSGSVDPVGSVVGGIMAFWLIMMPMIFGGHPWGPYRRVPGIEVTRPMGRRAFVAEVGLAVLWNLLRAWGAVVAGVGVVAVALAGVWPTGRASGRWVAAVLAVSLAAQVLMWGITVWTMRFRSEKWRAVGTMMAMALSMGASAAVVQPGRGLVGGGAAVWVAAGMVVAGVLVAGDAYRRWVGTDLD